jgi:hypothetical protein
MKSAQPRPSESGEYYDWRATRRPERPWIHAYHQSLVDKIWVGFKANPQTGAPAQLLNSTEQVLERIRRVSHLTRGIPHVTYLIGWQHDGHDSKYPDWSTVNPRLKRPGDASARESLIWLMREARKFNTTVSLHVNLVDAYRNSPLWDEYVAKGVIVRNPATGAIYEPPKRLWGGERAYWIDHAREWEAGLTQRRIDGLLDLLPIAEAGTIHIDAFYIPDHTDLDAQKVTMRKIFRYWRDRGVDVTSESMFSGRQGEGFIGLQPMAYVVNMKAWGCTLNQPEVTEAQQLEIPASLYCFAYDDMAEETGQLFGASMMGRHESAGNELYEAGRSADADAIDKDYATSPDFIQPFCLRLLPWHFLNRYDRLRLVREANGTRTLELSDGVVSRVTGDGHRTVHQQGRILVDGTDVCVPALWRPHREMIAYSVAGYSQREWEVPPDWHDVKRADLYQVGSAGLSPAGTVELRGHRVSLTLRGGQMMSVVPAGTAPESLQARGESSRCADRSEMKQSKQSGVLRS